MGWTNSSSLHVPKQPAPHVSRTPILAARTMPANKTTLGQVIEDTGKKTINYIYDFGDNWEHRIKIGRITDPVPGELYPRLIEVTGKCPPEDVGGFPGCLRVPRCHGRSNFCIQSTIISQTGRVNGTFDPNQPETDKLKLEVLSLAKRWKRKYQVI